MDIAVCFSGGVRYPHLGLKSLKNILPNENVKVFIHTWKVRDKESFIKTIFVPENKENEKIVETSLSFVEENFPYETLLIEDYEKKKEYLLDIFNSLKFSEYVRKDIGPISMHYSMYMSNLLKIKYEETNNMKFDKVIRMRFDSDFENKNLSLDLLESDFYIPCGCDWGDGINDQFAIGSSDVMDVYSELFLNYKNIENSKYYSEMLLKNHLSYYNLEPKRINFYIEINNGIDWRNQVNYSPLEFSQISYDTKSIKISELSKIFSVYNPEKSFNYASFYNFLFKEFKEKKIVFGAITSDKEKDIKPWKEYFSTSQLYHWINNSVKNKDSNLNYIDISNENAIFETLKKTKSKFDIIMDVSNSDFWSQIKIIRTSYEFLNNNGIIIIENVTYDETAESIDKYLTEIKNYGHDKFYSNLIEVNIKDIHNESKVILALIRNKFEVEK